MCDNNVGVAKRLDLEKISKHMSDLVSELDDKVSSEHVEIDVKKIKKIEKELQKVIS